MLVLNLPFKALMFLTLMRPSLVLFLVLWLKLVKDFLKVRCRLALLPFLISCLIWLDLVASLPLIKERILVIILLLHFLSLMLGRDRKSGSAGMPRPISYAVFCLKKKITLSGPRPLVICRMTSGTTSCLSEWITSTLVRFAIS